MPKELMGVEMNEIDFPWRILRFGSFKELDSYQEFRSCYDLLAINGNSAAFYCGALASLLSPVGKLGRVPFFIDPQTHAFQHPYPRHLITRKDETVEPRASVKKLAMQLGSPVQEKFDSKSNVTPECFSERKVSKEFTRRVLDFQNELVGRNVDEENMGKYLKFAGVETVCPHLLVAPYFFLGDENFEQWINVNVNLAQIACENESNVWAQIVMGKAQLGNTDQRNEIVEKYSSLPVSGYLLWIDAFPETEMSQPMLQAFTEVVRGLRGDDGRPVVNLYGGFFSLALTADHSDRLLSGVCHGLEYGQERGVVPIGGGIPMAKYYVPRFHKRYNYDEFLDILITMGWHHTAKQFQDEVCSCSECQRTLDGDIQNIGRYNDTFPVTFRRKRQIVRLNYPTEETKQRSLRHFMNVRTSEIGQVASSSRSDIAAKLEEDYGKCKSASRYISHLRTWAEVLKATSSSPD